MAIFGVSAFGTTVVDTSSETLVDGHEDEGQGGEDEHPDGHGRAQVSVRLGKGEADHDQHQEAVEHGALRAQSLDILSILSGEISNEHAEHVASERQQGCGHRHTRISQVEHVHVDIDSYCAKDEDEEQKKRFDQPVEDGLCNSWLELI